MSNHDPISDGPIHTRPRGFVAGTDQEAVLLRELEAAGVELGAYDKRIMVWLASWDWMTVATIASWIRRAAAQPADPAAQVVADFISQREEYIRVLRQCVEADADYHRWQGHAEARRQLADKLTAADGKGDDS